MDLRCWRKKAIPDDVLAWNVMVAATDPDRCWQIASAYCQTKLPSNVLTCEMSFLMGSIVRDAIRAAFVGDRQRVAIAAAESAYFKTFDDESTEALPEGMKAVYGDVRIGEVARDALEQYGEQSDMLYLTSRLFMHRIKGDPRDVHGLMPILQESTEVVRKLLKNGGR